MGIIYKFDIFIKKYFSILEFYYSSKKKQFIRNFLSNSRKYDFIFIRS